MEPPSAKRIKLDQDLGANAISVLEQDPQDDDSDFYSDSPAPSPQMNHGNNSIISSLLSARDIPNTSPLPSPSTSTVPTFAKQEPWAGSLPGLALLEQHLELEESKMTKVGANRTEGLAGPRASGASATDSPEAKAVMSSHNMQIPESSNSASPKVEGSAETKPLETPVTAAAEKEDVPTTDCFTHATVANNGDRNAEWRFDPSDAESDSSSESSSEDSNSDDEGLLLSAEEQAKALMSEIDASAKDPAVIAPVKSVNEQPEQFIEKPDIVVTPEMAITELGHVEKIINSMVLVKAKTSGEYRVLAIGSALCLEDKRVIGAVSDTLGRVQNPLYTVGFKNPEDIQELRLELGTKVFYVDNHSTYVFTEPLRALKGTDASNVNDEELDVEEVEFSDDEKEAEYKRKLKQERKLAKNGPAAPQPPEGPTGRGRQHARDSNRGSRKRKEHSPANRFSNSSSYPGEISYDDPTSNDVDVDDEMYRPLRRPDNLHEMMTFHNPIEVEPYSRRNHRGGPRGGRGKFGRSDRNRGHQGHGRGGFNNRQRGRQLQNGRRDSPDNFRDRRESPREFRRRNSPRNKQRSSRSVDPQSSPRVRRASPGRSSRAPPQPSPRAPQNDRNIADPQPAQAVQAMHHSQPPQAPQIPQMLQAPPPGSYAPMPNAPTVQQQYSAPTANPQSNIPAGAHINPAFFLLQQLMQAAPISPALQLAQAGATQSLAQLAPNVPPAQTAWPQPLAPQAQPAQPAPWVAPPSDPRLRQSHTAPTANNNSTESDAAAAQERLAAFVQSFNAYKNSRESGS